MTPLNRSQRLVIVVGLSAALYALGQWLMSIGSNLNYGWVAYAPLSKEFAPDGLHPWVRLVIWLVLITIWALVSVALLRSYTPRESDQR
jgi:heme/copper-type cytochrome/quinol oxidase subunit 1